MKISVQRKSIDYNAFGVMELNFGQSRLFAEKALYFCTIEFPEYDVIHEIYKAFQEIKDDARHFPDDRSEQWAVRLCHSSTYDVFKQDDTGVHVIAFLEFIRYDLLMELGRNNDRGSKTRPDYVFYAFVEHPLKRRGENIEISGICFKTSTQEDLCMRGINT